MNSSISKVDFIWGIENTKLELNFFEGDILGMKGKTSSTIWIWGELLGMSNVGDMFKICSRSFFTTESNFLADSAAIYID